MYKERTALCILPWYNYIERRYIIMEMINSNNFIEISDHDMRAIFGASLFYTTDAPDK